MSRANDRTWPSETPRTNSADEIRERMKRCTGCQKPKGTITTHQLGTVEHPGEDDEQS